MAKTRQTEPYFFGTIAVKSTYTESNSIVLPKLLEINDSVKFSMSATTTGASMSLSLGGISIATVTTPIAGVGAIIQWDVIIIRIESAKYIVMGTASEADDLGRHTSYTYVDELNDYESTGVVALISPVQPGNSYAISTP